MLRAEVVRGRRAAIGCCYATNHGVARGDFQSFDVVEEVWMQGGSSGVPWRPSKTAEEFFLQELSKSVR